MVDQKWDFGDRGRYEALCVKRVIVRYAVIPAATGRRTPTHPDINMLFLCRTKCEDVANDVDCTGYATCVS